MILTKCKSKRYLFATMSFVMLCIFAMQSAVWHVDSSNAVKTPLLIVDIAEQNVVQDDIDSIDAAIVDRIKHTKKYYFPSYFFSNNQPSLVYIRYFTYTRAPPNTVST